MTTNQINSIINKIYYKTRSLQFSEKAVTHFLVVNITEKWCEGIKTWNIDN